MKKVVIYITVTFLIVCSNSLFGRNKLTKDDVREKTRINWNIINTDNEQGVIREISRQHPLMPKTEVAKKSDTQNKEEQLESVKLRALDKKQAQD